MVCEFNFSLIPSHGGNIIRSPLVSSGKQNRFLLETSGISWNFIFQKWWQPCKFKVGDRVRITKYKNIFSKGYTKNWSREILVIDSVLKANPWTCTIKDVNEEKIRGSFYEKELLLSKL